MTSAPRIHFYGGIGTIGGTKIAVTEGEHRIIFDFGTAFAPGGDFWGGPVQPRTGPARLRDMIALGYIPALDGIYRADAAAEAGLAPGTGENTQIFISHLHLDHMSVVDLIADEVPVWMHADSLRLFRAVAETGEPPAVPVGARPFEWGQTIAVGPMKVTPVAVDHDIPGASALLIETSAGTVVYTGDLRLHGANPVRVDRFIEQARALNPNILLIEGTRLGEPEPSPDRPAPRSEPAVAPLVAQKAQEAGEALALITLYPRNTLRIGHIATAVKPVGRTLVLSAEAAHMYRALGGDMSQVALYQRSADKQALARGTAPAWLTGLFASGATVLDAAAVRANQGRYLLQLFYWDINELVDLQPAPGSVFIHSNGEPLGRFDPKFELFERWLAHFGIALAYAGASGHASSADLHKVVAGINPQLLMPIHSKAPELMEVQGVRRTLPEVGAIYDIATGEKVG